MAAGGVVFTEIKNWVGAGLSLGVWGGGGFFIGVGVLMKHGVELCVWGVGCFLVFFFQNIGVGAV